MSIRLLGTVLVAAAGLAAGRGVVATAIRPAAPSTLAANDQAVGGTSGAQAFASRCASCHGTDGNGGELGPAIVTRVPSRTDDELRSVIRQGVPTAGMPPFSAIGDAELGAILQHLRALRPRNG